MDGEPGIIHKARLLKASFLVYLIVFGVLGVLVVLTASGPDKQDSALSVVLIKLLFITVFIILPSFALSVASKYLSGKS